MRAARLVAFPACHCSVVPGLVRIGPFRPGGPELGGGAWYQHALASHDAGKTAGDDSGGMSCTAKLHGAPDAMALP